VDDYVGSAGGGQYGQGWLAAVIPAEARRFRVPEHELAEALSAAGAELVEESPDVEIAALDDLRGAAPFAVVSLAAVPRGGNLPVRAASRVARSVQVRLSAARARRALRARGYPFVDAVPWDVRHTFRPSGVEPAARPARLAEYLPLRALVVARRGERPRTLLDAVLAEAGAATGTTLTPSWSSIRAGILITSANGTLLRIAVGPASSQISDGHAALEALGAGEVPPLVANRVPWQLARGKEALADWSLERRLSGSPAGGELTEQLLGECVDFLVALHGCGRGDGTSRTAVTDAEVVARVFDAERAAVVRALARRLDEELAGTPRGFVHGDFFAGNLLVEDGKLAGVIDWDAGGPGRLPLLDLLHLRYHAEHVPADDDWGPGLVRHLVPWARSGGDEVARGYCARVGAPSGARWLEAAVLAYWLDRVAYQLRTHVHRHSQPRWLERNVAHVLNSTTF
jgi:aminoglycoside phosphotransferase (APT) family kinase protein